MVAESVRDDGCGHLQELLPDRGAAGGSGRDSDLAEKRGQVVGASFITLTTACAPALTTYGPHAPGEVKGAGVAVRPITGTPPGGTRMEGARFGEVKGYDGAPLPAPELPPVALKPRGRVR